MEAWKISIRLSYGTTLPLFRALNSLHISLKTNRIRNFHIRANTKIQNVAGIGKSFNKAYDALLLDAGGTLLQLVQPVEEIYASIGTRYGLTSTPAEIKQGFKRAFSAPWPQKLRYQGDGKPFWKLVVSEATGCADDNYFEEVYQHYANGDAWHLPHGAHATLALLKDAGEVGYEKPDGKIFMAALDQIGVTSSKAIHVGDDQKADKEGANAVGITCWLWGSEVMTFQDVQNRILIPDS